MLLFVTSSIIFSANEISSRVVHTGSATTAVSSVSAPDGSDDELALETDDDEDVDEEEEGEDANNTAWKSS